MTAHPAKFTDSILEAMRPYLNGKVLDPFAGTGKLRYVYPEAYLNELEPEWANQAPITMERVTVGDARSLDYPDEFFDVIATSPCYGNRMADHHNARDASKRITYTHSLGRKLTPGNAGELQWGEAYCIFHAKAWLECKRVLRVGGLFLLNISDHIRSGAIANVTEWHLLFLQSIGFHLVRHIKINTPRMRRGANYHLRVDYESLLVMEKK